MLFTIPSPSVSLTLINIPLLIQGRTELLQFLVLRIMAYERGNRFDSSAPGTTQALGTLQTLAVLGTQIVAPINNNTVANANVSVNSTLARKHDAADALQQLMSLLPRVASLVCQQSIHCSMIYIKACKYYFDTLLSLFAGFCQYLATVWCPVASFVGGGFGISSSQSASLSSTTTFE